MNTKKKLKVLKDNEKSAFIIHYSCESLNDTNENISPRITSIAVLHIESSTMHSFSIHLIAEINDVERDAIDEQYDNLEEKMLSDFYEFVKRNPDAFWIHWNMTNINYGFEAIAHRYKVLSKKEPARIADERKFNLSALIVSLYGKKSIDHPRMTTLMKLNDGEHRDLLSGQDEVSAFENKEYIKLHKSTMSKAYWFNSMYRLLQNNKVKVSNRNLPARINNFMEYFVVKLLGFIAVLFTLYQIVEKIWLS